MFVIEEYSSEIFLLTYGLCSLNTPGNHSHTLGLGHTMSSSRPHYVVKQATLYRQAGHTISSSRPHYNSKHPRLTVKSDVNNATRKCLFQI